MTPSRNTRFRSKKYKELLANVPAKSPTSLSLSKYNLNNIHSYIKDMTAMIDKHHSDMETLNKKSLLCLQNLPIQVPI